jgi:hypothetical protein
VIIILYTATCLVITSSIPRQVRSSGYRGISKLSLDPLHPLVFKRHDVNRSAALISTFLMTATKTARRFYGISLEPKASLYSPGVEAAQGIPRNVPTPEKVVRLWKKRSCLLS